VRASCTCPSEALVYRRAELLFDARLDLLPRARRDLVLQALQLGAELLREEVRHDREQLPDLDEQALEHEDGLVDALRVPLVDAAKVLISVRAAEELRLPDEPHVAEDDREGRPVGADEAPAVLAPRAVPNGPAVTLLAAGALPAAPLRGGGRHDHLTGRDIGRRLAHAPQRIAS
jgi:hypothetical protein